MRSFATLDDVALAAGLSRAQVSRALRGDPGVRPETRDHVQQVAERVNYRPNVAARSLAMARSTNVGLIIGEPLNPFHMVLARAIDEELARFDYDAVVSLRAGGDAQTVSDAERLAALRVAGLILISTPRTDAAIADVARRLPCIYVGKAVAARHVSTVSVDDADGAGQAIRHLIDLGHTRIAHIAGGEEPGAAGRTDGYRRAMQAVGLVPIEVEGSHGIDGGRIGIDRLRALPEMPTAIFVDNDIAAIGAINRLKGSGLRVPEDVSVVGFDDIPDAASETLSLTTLRQDPHEQAVAAVDELRRRLRDEKAPARAIMLPVRLQVRSSTMALG